MTDTLTALHTQLRRLLIAGPAAAKDDAQLVRLAAQLKVAASQTPALQRLEQLVLACSEGRDSPLAALSLTQALLVAQCKQPQVATPKAPRTAGSALTTTLPYSHLTALHAALTTAAPGRAELLQRAFDSNQLFDLRLLPSLCMALHSQSSEVSTLAALTLRGIGEDAVSALESRFTLTSSRRGNCLTFRLLAAQKDRGFTERVLQRGCSELRSEAVYRLRKEPDARPTLEALLLDNHKVVRVAALKALVQMGDKAALKALQKAQPTVAERHAADVALFDACIQALKLPRFMRQYPFLDNALLDF